MNFSDLKERYKKEKQNNPKSVNDLLDYVKKLYIANELSIREYRQLVKVLEQEGAYNPERVV